MTGTARHGEKQIAQDRLRNWKLLAQFRRRLAPRLARLASADPAAGRLFGAEDYLSSMLFTLLNPALKTARSFCTASRLDRVQEEVSGTKVPQSSFSEMQHLCDPALLAGLLRDLAAEALPVFGDEKMRAQVGELVANDGTLLPALPRMAWALWQDEGHRAAKLHLEFSVWRQVPAEFEVTPANDSERAAWLKKVRKGAFYVNDRGYSRDFSVIRQVREKGASFVLRLANNTVLTRLAPARELTPADRQAGVVEDMRVRLGGAPGGPEGRLVRVEADGHTFLLFTDREDLPAEMVGMIYRHRWQVELFFKWIKCILGCRHWLAESEQGVRLQAYCALVASVLIVLWTGRRPTKRQWEMLQLYWLGWATLEELEQCFEEGKAASAAKKQG